VGLSARDYEVLRFVPLEHYPYRLDVLGRVALVSLCVQVAEVQLSCRPALSAPRPERSCG
jgi:hypothetical protein